MMDLNSKQSVLRKKEQGLADSVVLEDAQRNRNKEQGKHLRNMCGGKRKTLELFQYRTENNL